MLPKNSLFQEQDINKEKSGEISADIPQQKLCRSFVREELGSCLILAVNALLADTDPIDPSKEKLSFEINHLYCDDYGDLSVNLPLCLAKLYSKNPINIGKLIIKELKLPLFFSNSCIKEPGFLNFYYSKHGLNSILLNANTQIAHNLNVKFHNKTHGLCNLNNELNNLDSLKSDVFNLKSKANNSIIYTVKRICWLKKMAENQLKADNMHLTQDTNKKTLYNIDNLDNPYERQLIVLLEEKLDILCISQNINAYSGTDKLCVNKKIKAREKLLLEKVQAIFNTYYNKERIFRCNLEVLLDRMLLADTVKLLLLEALITA